MTGAGTTGMIPASSQSVVLATCVTYRQLDAPRVADLIGSGVFYGSAISEAHALKDQDIFIVGAGNSAGQAAIYFAQSARSVTLLSGATHWPRACPAT